MRVGKANANSSIKVRMNIISTRCVSPLMEKTFYPQMI